VPDLCSSDKLGRVASWTDHTHRQRRSQKYISPPESVRTNACCGTSTMSYEQSRRFMVLRTSLRGVRPMRGKDLAHPPEPKVIVDPYGDLCSDPRYRSVVWIDAG